MPVDLVQLPQRLGLPWSGLDAMLLAAVAAFLVCLLIVVIDVCYLSVSCPTRPKRPAQSVLSRFVSVGR